MEIQRYAAICKMGHPAEVSLEQLVCNIGHCTKCGWEIITNCQNCGAAIQGVQPEPDIAGFLTFDVPKICHSCGHPFPWTELALTKASGFIDSCQDIETTQKPIAKAAVHNIVIECQNSLEATVCLQSVLSTAKNKTQAWFRQFIADNGCDVAKDKFSL